MQPSILSLGCVTPGKGFSQKQLTELGIEAFGLEGETKEWYEKVSLNSSIVRRYTVCSSLDEIKKLAHGTIDIRNEFYKEQAPKLALEAAKKVVTNPQEITHVIAVSCTGVMAPGIEVELIEGLGLNPNVERVGINFMGCFGALRGLSLANAFALNNPKNRVLVVCVELCSLHALGSETKERLLGNALFADGAAACVVGVGDGLWKIVKNSSQILPKTKEEMSWELGTKSLLMKMTLKVPLKIRDAIKAFSNELIEDRPLETCEWAIHPGGKSILEGIEKACRLSKEQTQESWDVLKHYGNMSSPTFLFVLDALRRRKKRLPWTVGFGFGPGLAVEGILLKNETLL